MEKILSVAVLNLDNDINIGGIVRTANAAGVKEIIIVGRRKWNKSSATGAHRKTPLKLMVSSEEFLEYCLKENYQIVSLEITETSQDIFEFDYPNKTMLVIGNEGKGVLDKILTKSFAIVKIPQYGDVECLNAAISAGIAIYDWARKNNCLKEKNIDKYKFV